MNMPAHFTDADAANGWTREAVAEYHAERDKAAGLIAGNLVTSAARPRQPIRIENCRTYDPHRRWRWKS